MAAERSQIRESKRGSTCEKQRPLMLKDFLNDTSSIHVPKLRQYHRRNSKECPTTVKYLLGMEPKSKKKAFQGIGVVSFKHASSTRSALRRASEVLVKLLPFSIQAPSEQRNGTTMPQRHSINKLGSFPHRLPSARECRARPDESLSRRLSAALRSISLRRQCNKKRAEIQVRVRDIVRSASFGDEDISSCKCSNPETPPREEAHVRTHDATSDSLSPSRTSSYTWSDFGPESDCASTLQSSSGSSVCSEADVMKDKMLLLNYQGKGEEGAVVDEILQKGGSCERPTSDTPIRLLACDNARRLARSEGGSDSLDSCCANEEEADIQRLEHDSDGRNVRSNAEGHEKELFSPISVLDFSFEDEVTAASFEEGLANVRRTKRQLLLKIGRPGILSQLDLVELQKHLASSEFEILNEDSESFINHDSNIGHELNDVKMEDVEECVREILSEFLDAPTKRQWGSFELLAIDILREELSIASELDENELVKIASGRIREWLLMENQMDEGRELSVKEMEVNQDWMKFTTDKEEMVMELEVTVLRSLVHELFLDLID